VTATALRCCGLAACVLMACEAHDVSWLRPGLTIPQMAERSRGDISVQLRGDGAGFTFACWESSNACLVVQGGPRVNLKAVPQSAKGGWALSKAEFAARLARQPELLHVYTDGKVTVGSTARRYVPVQVRRGEVVEVGPLQRW
jgi:hypothetical protein